MYLHISATYLRHFRACAESSCLHCSRRCIGKICCPVSKSGLNVNRLHNFRFKFRTVFILIKQTVFVRAVHKRMCGHPKSHGFANPRIRQAAGWPTPFWGPLQNSKIVQFCNFSDTFCSLYQPHMHAQPCPPPAIQLCRGAVIWTYMTSL
eukprot:jgi/Botrbrau1/20715/Bobra.0058s0044.1